MDKFGWEEVDECRGLEEHLDYENGAYGDPRRCPHHPHVHTSSPDGMFDAPCWVCESEMDADDAEHYPDPGGTSAPIPFLKLLSPEDDDIPF